MAPDFTLKIKEAETEFRAPISKPKDKPDFHIKGKGIRKRVPGSYIEGKGSRKNFHIKGTTVQETERQVPVLYFKGPWLSGASFRRSKMLKVRVSYLISKVQDAEGL
ncbi:hypothetical protein RIR_jg32042.t1 [Rhizophagus irregularis DAOM 181602=DAOM 197198]|nr:hypothetical protein RIR_jg32042.t1 [Rhizophagus irregularis DAOM 181602=DAOM 197198]